MEKVGKSKTSRKTRKPRVVAQETPVKETISLGRALIFIFKVITLPFYMIYVLFFKIPTEGPAPIVGLLRFIIFAFVGYFLEQHHRIDYFVKDYATAHNWMSGLAETILGVYAIIMLLNLFLSFIEIFGFSTGSYWYDPHESASNNSFSGYDAIEEGINYRDALLRAKHTPGKIEELKKTGFITKERISGLGSSPEVNEAFVLLNSQMRAQHNPDKLKTLEKMFGGK
jgi:hypothetical protein